MIKTILPLLELLAILLPAAVFLGRYMARVFQGERSFLSPLLRPVERLVYRLCRIDESREMSGRTYAISVVSFTLISVLLLFLLQLLQGVLPLNPQGLPGVRWDTARNTAISFCTNTNWQSYAGETTMSHLTQMLGLAVQNFLSAGVGIAVALAMMNLNLNFRIQQKVKMKLLLPLRGVQQRCLLIV